MTSLTASKSVTREIELAGERFMTLGTTLLVASKSKPGEWYRIEDAKCSCPGFTYRGHCRHIAASLQMEPTTTDASVTIEITTECGGGWVVKWAGYVHGGIHSRREDAEGHADELRHAPAWDRQSWIERHAFNEVAPTGRPSLTLLEGGRR